MVPSQEGATGKVGRGVPVGALLPVGSLDGESEGWGVGRSVGLGVGSPVGWKADDGQEVGGEARRERAQRVELSQSGEG